MLTTALGDYSEMTVAAAFIARGYEVALPFGNSHRWDMVVRESAAGPWQSVQVKTIPRVKEGTNPALHVHRQNKERSPYTVDDIQLLVAIHPETGTMWKVPIEFFAGRKKIKLNDEHVWAGSIERTLVVGKNPTVSLKSLHARQAEERSAIKCALPDKPATMSDDTWAMVLRWCNGYGFKLIAKDYSICTAAVAERVKRALKRVGLRYPEKAALTPMP